jgi:hypothetical protein
MIAAFTGTGKRIGFADARESATYFYQQKIAVPQSIKHAIDRNIYLVNTALNCEGEYRPPQFKENKTAAESAQQLLSKHGFADRTILIAITPASRWLSKSWPSFFLPRLFNESIKIGRGNSAIAC